MSKEIYSKVEVSFSQLKHYCEEQNFKGWDPYDGLNSRIFQLSLFKNYYFTRLAWIQLFRRNPVNLRKILRVNKEHNPKGLGLFLTGYCNYYQISQDINDLNQIKSLCEIIIQSRSMGYSGACWGYNFDWQAKAFFQPKFTPTIVATCFIANSLLDAYQITRNEKLLKIARSSCDFILNDLNRTEKGNNQFAFSYSPIDKSVIFNASLLGCRLLSRVYSYTKEEELINAAEYVIRFCVSYQNENGSWSYGTLAHHQWIDNFHTGYNLEGLIEYENYTKDSSYRKYFNLGLDFYLNNLFTSKGEPKGFHNNIYPIDIHSTPQLIVTLYRSGLLNDYENIVNKVLEWTLKNMQSPSGYFYYKKGKFIKNKIPYIRWSQAWMFYGLSYYLLNRNDG